MIVPTAAKNVPWAQKSQSLAQPPGKAAAIVPTAAENVLRAQKSQGLALPPEKEAMIVRTAAENVPWAQKSQSPAQPPEKEAIIYRQPRERNRQGDGDTVSPENLREGQPGRRQGPSRWSTSASTCPRPAESYVAGHICPGHIR